MERFVDNGDGTITDTLSELVWQKEDDGKRRTLAESEAYCGGLSLGGYNHWRIPTIVELRLIATEWKQIFPTAKDDQPYWSSTLVRNPGWEPQAGEKHKYVAYVLFSNGLENTYFLYNKYYTRAVRS